MKKRNRIMLLPVMILAAVLVFLIIRGPAGSGRDPGEQLVHFQTAGKTEQGSGTSP